MFYLDCGDPTPVNGSVSDPATTYNTTVGVSCETGYSLSGSAEIVCQADGTWSDSPTCLENGKLQCFTKMYVLLNS